MDELEKMLADWLKSDELHHAMSDDLAQIEAIADYRTTKQMEDMNGTSIK